MTNRPLKPTAILLSAVMVLGAAPAPVPQVRDADKPGDGVVSPAVCAVYGFPLPESRRPADTMAVASAAPLPT